MNSKIVNSLNKDNNSSVGLNQFQKEIESLKFSTLPTSNNNFFEDNEIENQEVIFVFMGNFIWKEEVKDENNWSFEKRNTGSKSDFLTGHVWVFLFWLLYKNIKPKSRMLLAIVSKMSKEGLLNSQQKGKRYIKLLVIFK